MTSYSAEDLMNEMQGIPDVDNLREIVDELHEEWAPEESPDPEDMAGWVCERFGTRLDEVTPENLNEMIVLRAMQLKKLDCFVKAREVTREDGDMRDKLAHIGKIIREARNVLQANSVLFQRMDPGMRISMPSDWNVENFFQFADEDEKTTTFQRLLQHMLHLCEANELRKYEDSVYKEKRICVEGQEFSSHAWEPECTIVEFIYKSVRKEVDYDQWKNLTNPPHNAELVAKHLENSFQSELPSLEVNRYMWTYTNGIYNAEHDMFYPFSRRGEWKKMAEEITEYRRRKGWGEGYKAVPPQESDVCVKYIDIPFRPCEITPEKEETFDAESIVMPEFEKILNAQKFVGDTKKWFIIFLGRLFFEMGFDNWQRMLYIKGVAGSAKSTIAMFLRSFFPDHLLSTIPNNVEPRFGLEPIYQSLICICTETREDFGLDQAAWQAAVSAESMSIPRKHRTAVTVDKWRTQLFFVGNQLPNYPTASGSVERRLLIFNFDQKPTPKDLTLPKRLLQNADLFHRKAVSMYLKAKREYGEVDLVDAKCLGSQLTDFMSQMREEVDSIYAFIKNECTLDSGARVLLKEFKGAYANFTASSGTKRTLNEDNLNSVSNEFAFVIEKIKRTKYIKGLKLNEDTAEEEEEEEPGFGGTGYGFSEFS